MLEQQLLAPEDRPRQMEPKDEYNLVYAAFVVLGIAILLPYSSFVSAPTYFQKYYMFFGDDEEPTGGTKRYYSNIENWFLLLFSITSTVSGLTLQFVIHKVSATLRLTVSMAFNIIILWIPPALSFIRPHWGPTSGAAILSLSVIATALSAAVLEGSVYGLQSMMPPRYAQAVMIGIGSSSVLVALIGIITVDVWDFGEAASREEQVQQLQMSGAVYFGIGSASLLFALIIYLLLPRLKYYQWQLKRFNAGHTQPDKIELLTEDTKTKSTKHKQDDSCKDDSMVEMEVRETESPTPVGDEATDIADAALKSTTDGANNGTVNVTVESEATTEDFSVEKKPDINVLNICWKVKRFVYTIIVNYIITLWVFPGEVVQISLQNDSLDNQTPHINRNILPVLSILLYCIGDTIGRGSGHIVKLVSPNLLPIFATSRVVFIPLFALCVKPLVFKSQWIGLILVVFLGLTNGYSTCLSMIYAPLVSSVQFAEKETVGAVLGTSLFIGISLGSVMGLVFVQSWQNLGG
eukprot:TRINITY_DN67060_c7_g5_i1.p1 TRINITY_DN67060_c7_g5~~TRINITY_DN67060_c7_g5_i1.p1  ORF type:complete len:532 (-),score=37.36 TRINITY_DN67060_c7_g5_i1:1266-2828(-)